MHEETVRIVDAQMKDMATQMQALDEFVSRARAQNGQQYEGQLQAMRGIASTVTQSYAVIGENLTSSYDDVRTLGAGMADRTAALIGALPPLDASVRQPLAELRIAIAEAPMRAYVPTGATPQRVAYQYPTTLPRTAEHAALLANLHRTTSTAAVEPCAAATVGVVSPTKSVVYNDDGDDGTDELRPAVSSGGLREVAVNLGGAGAGALALPAAPAIVAPSPRRAMLPPPRKGQASAAAKGRENAPPRAGRRLRKSGPPS